MSKVKFELNLPGLNQLMKSPEMQGVLLQKANEVMSRANGLKQDPKAEFYTMSKAINYIAVANVRCANGEAVHENLENNTLLKAL